jgi:hypothetical protein
MARHPRGLEGEVSDVNNRDDDQTTTERRGASPARPERRAAPRAPETADLTDPSVPWDDLARGVRRAASRPPRDPNDLN